jgi:hypothetical protein
MDQAIEFISDKYPIKKSGVIFSINDYFQNLFDQIFLHRAIIAPELAHYNIIAD